MPVGAGLVAGLAAGAAPLIFALAFGPFVPRAIRIALVLTTAVPEDKRRLLDAVEHAARGETLALTPEETARYCETGELPERVARWTASRD